MSSFVGRVGAVCIAVAATFLVCAPAQAGPDSNACLVVVNQLPDTVVIHLDNAFPGSHWEVGPYATTLLTTEEGRAIASDAGWVVRSPPRGTWHYESSLNTDWGCDGSWVFTTY
ncbi:hypothetical protein [Nocardia fluminea]|uniref:Uncharacterized protein n=1 Tax=Nocardia fluminea TaxID=134984 RepID=A0A2N3VDS1_9NOCA|nr:hypothetical protein [Nocardia fluminea]PKV79747.1 hypothetical protein ATK86_4158 [Nocardia fluminea]